MKTIRSTIAEAGRLEEILSILNKIFSLDGPDWPVDIEIDYENDHWSNRVNLRAVRDQIGSYLQYINYDDVADLYEDYDIADLKMHELLRFVNSELNMKLHNYANGLAHRRNVSYEDLEEIRAYSILSSSIEYFECGLFNELDEETNQESFHPFSIPEGWRKV